MMRFYLPASLFALVAFAGCASINFAGSLSDSGAGGAGGGGGFFGEAGSAASGSTGAGGDAGGTTPASYGYLCGGSGSTCRPGTSDCTPGGNPNMSSGSGGSALGCQIIPAASGVTAVCNPVGNGGAGDPCVSAAHCGAGLGCVTNTSGGVCRQYCCLDVEACPTDTYCSPIRMTEAADKIPVCTPVTKCTLLDDSICSKTGQVCTIVRKDGTTSCVDPGPGQRGDQCPCADGYVCSQISNTCLKLCHIGNDAVDCPGGGACQGGSSSYPQGFGICVGYNK